jgi:hypothetical protein
VVESRVPLRLGKPLPVIPPVCGSLVAKGSVRTDEGPVVSCLKAASYLLTRRHWHGPFLLPTRLWFQPNTQDC